MIKAALDDAFASLSVELRELSLGDEVDRVEGPMDPLDFYRRYVAVNKPCIVTGAISHWASLTSWTNSYLAKRLGHQLITVDLTPDGHGDAIVEGEERRICHELAWDEREDKGIFEGGGVMRRGDQSESKEKDEVEEWSLERHSDVGAGNSAFGGEGCSASVSDLRYRTIEGPLFVMPEERKMTYHDFVELLARSRVEKWLGVPYAQHQNDSLLTEYSVLSTDAERDIPWASTAMGCQPEAVNLWIGDERAVTSFHKDHYENLYAVVAGEKHFTLLPPADVHRLYVTDYKVGRYKQQRQEGGGGGGCFSIEMCSPAATVPWVTVDPYPADVASAAERFPRFFDGPPPLTCTVRAGEVLFLPSMWFHHVRQTPDPEGRTIAINFWYDMQYDVRYAYFNLLRTVTGLRDSMDEDREEDGMSPEMANKLTDC